MKPNTNTLQGQAIAQKLTQRFHKLKIHGTDETDAGGVIVLLYCCTQPYSR